MLFKSAIIHLYIKQELCIESFTNLAIFKKKKTSYKFLYKMFLII